MGHPQRKFSFLVFAIAAFFVIATASAQTKTLITDIDDLKDIINQSGAGDTIVLGNGVHDGNSITVTAGGEVDNPLVIMSESVGGSEMTGDSKFVLDGTSYVVIHGFKFTNSGTAVKLEGSNNIRITRNIFDLNEESSTKWVFVGGIWDEPTTSLSHHNRIDHNTFQNKSEAGHYITIDGSGGVTQSQFDLIDHNHFRNNMPRFENEKESIRVGWSEMSESSGFTTIEFNFFEYCNGDPEIISIKSCDNIIRHNTITKSEGTISLRHGNRNRVEGNYIFGGGTDCSTDNIGTHCSGGIRIYGEDHVIVNNYLQGLKGNTWDAPIALTEGDADKGNTSLSKHFRIEKAIIAYNTLVDNDYGIEIGYDNNGKYSKPAKDVVIAYNIVSVTQNELIKYYNDPDNMTWKNNVMYVSGSAVLTSDASKSFTNEEILEVDPKLSFDETLGIWRSTSDTPTFDEDNTLTGEVVEDVDGQTRHQSSSVGADDYSMESIRFPPLTADDVGPFSFHPDYDGEVAIDHLVASVSSLDFEESAGSVDIEITSNIEWMASSDQGWITVNPASGSENGMMSISVTANDVAEIRTGNVSITGELASLTIAISQAPMGLGGEKIDVVKVTASAEQNEPGKENVKENTLDGELDTRWSAEGEQFITFELEELSLVSYLKIAFYNGDERSTHYQIDVSVDNVSFTNVVEKTLSSGLTSGFETIDFDDTNAKYVKLTGFGNTGGSDWNSISEVEIWGEVGAKGEVLNTTSIKIDKPILYPLPVGKGELFIQNLDASYSSYRMFDLSGKIIKEKELDHSSIDLSKFDSGTWLLILISDTLPNLSYLIPIN